MVIINSLRYTLKSSRGAIRLILIALLGFFLSNSSFAQEVTMINLDDAPASERYSRSPQYWNNAQSIFGKYKPENEIIENRDATSKHFRISDEITQAVISSMPVHYKDELGKWQEINTDVKASSDPNFGLQNITNTLQSYFPAQNLSDIGVQINHGNNNLVISKNVGLVFIDSTNAITTLVESGTQATANSSGNVVTYTNSLGDADIEFIVERSLLKHNVRLKSFPQALDALNGLAGFSEEVELPGGWQLLSNGTPITTATTINSELTIVDAQGIVAYVFPRPEIYEENDPSTSFNNPDGTNNIGQTYRIEPSGNSYVITTLVSIDWLRSRTYPVIIDPTVTLYGNYGGWVSTSSAVEGNPSVYVYSASGYGAWTKFTTSSITTGTTITSVKAYLVCNLVSSTTAATVSINDVTGTYGPYGGANGTAYTDLTNGSYASFSCNGTGNYGPYTLSATAATHLQSRLSSGVFQLGYSNTTTNYKRFTSNGNYIIVDYGSCINGLVGSAVTPTCSNQTISVGSGERRDINVISGRPYQFTLSACPSGWTMQLTGRNTSDTQMFQSSSACTVTANWTATYTGVLRLNINRSNCLLWQGAGLSATLTYKQVPPSSGATTTWIGGTSGTNNWNVDSNWDNCIPNININANIPNVGQQPGITTASAARSLTIATGKVVTVACSNCLQVGP